MKRLTYWPGSYEYEQLRIAAEQMTIHSPRGLVYSVADVQCCDYWKTTVVDNYGMGGGDALTDAEREKAIFSTSLEQFAKEYFKAHPNG